jgi:hypothetical protein
VVAVVDADGFRRIDDDVMASVVGAVVDGRRGDPGGARFERQLPPTQDGDAR